MADVAHGMPVSSSSLDDCQVASNLETLHLRLVVPKSYSLVLPIIRKGITSTLLVVVQPALYNGLNILGWYPFTRNIGVLLY